MVRFKLFLSILLLFSVSLVHAQKFAVTGVITDRETRVPIVMGSVFISETTQGTASDEKGMFEIRNIGKGSYHLCSCYLGYEAFDTIIYVDKPLQISIRLVRTSLQLKEVNVMAREKKTASTTSSMQRAAIEHLQPSSMSDVLQLLPGGLLSDSKLNTTNSVSMRQAGSDVNTAMGTAVVQDGVPMSNDYNMQSFYGTSSSDVSSSKSSVNSGVDMRQISTDHVEEVEVIRGIPSVKYGDLTSGAIIIKSKKGATPMTLRVKSDPLNKLVYVGKGFKLPGEWGTLNVGIDYTKFVADQRSPFDQYQRITSNLSHERKFGKSFTSSTQLAYTGTIDKKINDPDVMNREDTYRSDYNSVRFSNSGTWNIGLGSLNKLEYTVSGQYANDVLERTKTVTLNSPMGLTLNSTDGESLGLFLPSEYLSTYSVDGKPFNFYSQVTAYVQPKIGETFNNILLGAEFRLDKNLGDGAMYDLTRPPFPTMSSSSRPRAPKDIPSMQKLILFGEEHFKANIGEGKLDVTGGLRATMLGNVASSSALYHTIYTEPRLNASYQLPSINVGKTAFNLTLKGGLGDQVKFPTVMQMYPEKAYYDISELNYYTANEANRLVYLLTVVKNRTNYNLIPARNRKIEGGFDLSFGGNTLNLTVFHENERNGFEAQSLYFPQVYKLYDPQSFAGTGLPSVSDFTYTNKSMFLAYSTTTNAAVVQKNGIEYQWTTRKIKAINTEIVVNGAWFETTYDISDVRYEYPTIVTSGNYYPYMGIYKAGDNSKVRNQLNTNLFLNTHLSKQRLMFSTSVQTVWTSSYQMMEYSGVPFAYVGLDGVQHPFTDTEKNDPAFKPLIETFSSAYFKPEVSPISVEVNLKVTKEIGSNLKLSFFVNRLIDYNPRYYSRFGVATQKWVTPFMGAEIQVKI
jgi:hypothetical protein